MQKKVRVLAFVMAFVMTVGFGGGGLTAKADSIEQVLTNRILVVTAADGMWMHSLLDSTPATDVRLLAKGTSYVAESMVTVTNGAASVSYIKIKDTTLNQEGYVVYSEAFCYLTAAAVETATEVANTVAYCNAVSGVYIHASESLYSARVGSLLYGQTAQMVSKTNQWAKVLFINDSNVQQYGFVYFGNGYVTSAAVNTAIDGIAGQAAETETPLTNGVAIVTYSTAINVHASASCESRVMTKLSKGAVIKAVASTPTWVKVSFVAGSQTYTGYIYKAYTSLATGKTVSSPAGYSVKVGKTLGLSISLTQNTTLSYIKWTSSNKKKAVVNARGIITGVKKGKVTITAKLYNGNKKIRAVKFKVKVKK